MAVATATSTSSTRSAFARFLTFERYPGRLNNQLLTLDWAFRFARAFNRTLFVAATHKKIDWVGFPESRDEEALADGGASLWDLSALRRDFDFVLEHERAALGPAAGAALARDAAALDPRCVWTEKDGKHLVRWLKRVPTWQPHCRSVVCCARSP